MGAWRLTVGTCVVSCEWVAAGGRRCDTGLDRPFYVMGKINTGSYNIASILGRKLLQIPRPAHEIQNASGAVRTAPAILYTPAMAIADTMTAT